MQYRLLGVPLSMGIFLFLIIFFTFNDESDSVITLNPTIKPEGVPPSLEEQVGRLFIVGHWSHTPVASTTALIENYGIGGVIIMSSPENPEEILSWTKTWQAAAKHPLMIAIDQEGGVVSRLSGSDYIQTSQPEIHTKETAFTVAKQRGEELQSLGINTNFAPVIETSVSPNGFLYDRVFRNHEMIGLLGRATLNGYKTSGVTGVIKHYPGHEDEPADSHTELPVVELENTTFSKHTENFNELIGLNIVDVIMTAHVLVPSLDSKYPATLSKRILTGELREKQNYDGIVITDDMTMDAIDARFGITKATELALEAGADLILFAAEPQAINKVIPAILQSINSNELSEETIAEHYRRIDKWLKK